MYPHTHPLPVRQKCVFEIWKDLSDHFHAPSLCKVVVVVVVGFVFFLLLLFGWFIGWLVSCFFFLCAFPILHKFLSLLQTFQLVLFICVYREQQMPFVVLSWIQSPRWVATACWDKRWLDNIPLCTLNWIWGCRWASRAAVHCIGLSKVVSLGTWTMGLLAWHIKPWRTWNCS